MLRCSWLFYWSARSHRGDRTATRWCSSTIPDRFSIACALASSTAARSCISSWYAPHGWIAWGPRLLLPWLPAIVYLTCYFYPNAIEQGAASLGANPWRVSIAFAFFAAFALPNFFEVLDTRLLQTLFQPDHVFPHPMPIQEDRAGYFAYVNYLMWSKRSMLIDCYDWVLHRSFRDRLLLYVACMAVLAQAIAGSARKSVVSTRR